MAAVVTSNIQSQYLPNAYIAGDITLTGGGSVLTTANGDVVFNPNGTGAVLFPNGAVGTPSIGFSSDPDTGFYWTSSGVMRWTINGVNKGNFTTNGISIKAGLDLDDNITLNSGGSILSTSGGDIAINPDNTGDILLYSNTGLSFSLDGTTGIHSFPKTSYCGATSDVGTQSISSGGTGTTVIFEDEATDNQGEYDHTTGVFTATVAGWYRATWSVGLDNVAWVAGDQMLTYLSYNNVSSLASASTRRGHRWNCQANGTYSPQSIGSGEMYLAATDTLRIKVYHDRGTATNLSSNAQVNHVAFSKVA